MDESGTKDNHIYGGQALRATSCASCEHIAWRFTAPICTFTPISSHPRALAYWSVLLLSSLRYAKKLKRAAMFKPPLLLASGWLKKLRLPASSVWYSTARVFVIMAALRRWQRPRVKLA